MRKWNQKMYKQALRFERLEFCEQSRRFYVEDTLILSVQLKIKLRTNFFLLEHCSSTERRAFDKRWASQGGRVKRWQKLFASRVSKKSQSSKIFSPVKSGITTVQHAENLCICSARYDRKLLLRFLAIEIRLPSCEVIEKVNVESETN